MCGKAASATKGAWQALSLPLPPLHHHQPIISHLYLGVGGRVQPAATPTPPSPTPSISSQHLGGGGGAACRLSHPLPSVFNPIPHLQPVTHPYIQLTTFKSNYHIVSFIHITSGDTNLDALKYGSNDQVTTYLDSLFTSGFLQTITRPTRCTSHSATLIDHSITNVTQKSYTNLILTSKFSDHFPILIITESQHKRKVKNTHTF